MLWSTHACVVFGKLGHALPCVVFEHCITKRKHARRVMVEFDQPGHASSWCIGYPAVCPSPTCKGPLNPASTKTFDLIESVLGECTGKKPLGGLFPETMIHLGGDEVNTACWNEVPAIAKWLTANNLTTDGG